MMTAYFDESGTHQGSPVVCVAGYLFSAEQAQHLDREWAAVLKQFNVRYFHAVECAQGVKEFALLSSDQRAQLTKLLIGIIKRRMQIGIAVSMSDTDFGQVKPPQWERGGPSLFCSMMAVLAVTGWAEEHAYNGKISYCFEDGDEHKVGTQAAINELKQSPIGFQNLRYHSHSFAGKRNARPLQAADLLAYEWHKELKRLNGPRTNRTMRRSLESLLDQSHYTMHFGARDVALFIQGGVAALIEKIRFTLVE